MMYVFHCTEDFIDASRRVLEAHPNDGHVIMVDVDSVQFVFYDKDDEQSTTPFRCIDTASGLLERRKLRDRLREELKEFTNVGIYLGHVETT